MTVVGISGAKFATELDFISRVSWLQRQQYFHLCQLLFQLRLFDLLIRVTDVRPTFPDMLVQQLTLTPTQSQ